MSKLDSKTGPIMADITGKVIEAMKAGTAPWQKPWIARGGSSDPINLQTGKNYRGLNALYLRILGTTYGSDYWVGYKQAQQLGGHVRKGEQSTAILAPMIRKGKDDNDNEYQYVAGFRAVRVFNAMQCDGLALPVVDDGEPRELDAHKLDQFAANTGAVIDHVEGNRAFYVPSVDRVQLPMKNQFTSEGGYYGTLLHELIHWTGHKSRMDRLGEKSDGKRGYAFEELIAELGAYYASEQIDCPNESENHASYLDSWLKALDSDPKYLWQAASMAERAADYLIKLGTQTNKAAA